MKFRDFRATFMEISAERNSMGELAQKRMALDNHLIPYFGNMQINSIGKPEIRRYRNEKLEFYKPKTVNNHLMVLSRFLNVARDERVFTAHPFRIELIPIDQRDVFSLSNEQCAAVMDAATKLQRPIYAAMIRVALFTGIRFGELVALDWSRVNLNGMKREVIINAAYCRASNTIKQTKSRKPRILPLHPEAAKALVALPHRHGLVFDVSYSAAYDAIQAVAEEAGLPYLGWHTLRHTFASLMMRQGESLLVVSKMLGHASMRTTERYTHALPEDFKMAMRRFHITAAA